MTARPPRRIARAFSMAETVISVVIVAGLFVAALNTAGSAAAARRSMTERADGILLAEEMMTEILQLPYKEPGTTVLGLEAGESSSSTRAWFDDIDDYDGWDRPPQDKAGSPVAWAGRYQVRVGVRFAAPANLNETQSSDGGVKRIRVEVTRGGHPVAILTAYRTQTWSQTSAMVGG